MATVEDWATLEEVTALEASYAAGVLETLAPARAGLVARWRSGERDRETALRLAFLDWYSCAEPRFLTGLLDVSASQSVESSFFLPACDHLLTACPGDVEVLFVFGWMLTSHPWCAGTASATGLEARGRALWAAYQDSPTELDGVVFAGRGVYGTYFARVRASHPQ